MELYAVRILNRIAIAGHAQRVDKYFDDEHYYYEETIKAVAASDFDEAEKKAELEAQKNACCYTNIYGQSVRYEFVKIVDTFLLSGCEDGDELYSATFRLPKSMEQNTLEKRFEYLKDEKDMRVLRDKDY